MKTVRTILALVGTISVCIWSAPNSAIAQTAAASTNSQVHVVITDAALRNDSELPPLRKEDITVKLNKNTIVPSALIPAQGDQGALQLMILIDDTLDSGVGNNLTDIKNFVKALPDGTQVGVAYMSNASVNIAQNFTPDRDLAANSIRLPRSNLSSMDSSFLSLISLIKGWPQQKVRREVIMITDGIDRLRGERPTPVGAGPYGTRPGRPGAPTATVYHSMPTISNDATTASEIGQRNNVVVFTIYAPGIGRAGRSECDRQLGIGNLTKIADETGGECFSLGTLQPVSFKPWLDTVLKYVNNQYYLVFQGTPKKGNCLQRIDVRTVAKNSEILAPDNVCVAANGEK